MVYALVVVVRVFGRDVFSLEVVYMVCVHLNRWVNMIWNVSGMILREMVILRVLCHLRSFEMFTERFMKSP